MLVATGRARSDPVLKREQDAGSVLSPLQVVASREMLDEIVMFRADVPQLKGFADFAKIFAVFLPERHLC